MLLSSPPRRGCFRKYVITVTLARVFPASAGVFPASSTSFECGESLPRLGGGVSQHQSENLGLVGV